MTSGSVSSGGRAQDALSGRPKVAIVTGFLKTNVAVHQLNNAGVFIPKPFTEYTAEDFRRATQTNLAGFFYVCNSRWRKCVSRNSDMWSTFRHPL